jgi:hypothetical protein
MLPRASHPITLLALLMLPACGKKLVTTTITPSHLESKNSGNFPVAGGCRNEETLGPSLKSTPGQSALFGYWNWELGQGTACRVFVKFDLASLAGKSVVVANLHWGETTQRAEGGIAANFPPCEKTMFVANQAWTKFNVPGDEVGEVNGAIQVGAIVRDWVSGKRLNQGLFFVGQEQKILKENTDYCFSLMKNFTLEVTSAVP